MRSPWPLTKSHITNRNRLGHSNLEGQHFQSQDFDQDNHTQLMYRTEQANQEQINIESSHYWTKNQLRNTMQCCEASTQSQIQNPAAVDQH